MPEISEFSKIRTRSPRQGRGRLAGPLRGRVAVLDSVDDWVDSPRPRDLTIEPTEPSGVGRATGSNALTWSAPPPDWRDGLGSAGHGAPGGAPSEHRLHLARTIPACTGRPAMHRHAPGIASRKRDRWKLVGLRLRFGDPPTVIRAHPRRCPRTRHSACLVRGFLRTRFGPGFSGVLAVLLLARHRLVCQSGGARRLRAAARRGHH